MNPTIPKELENWISFLEARVNTVSGSYAAQLRRAAKQLMREFSASVQLTPQIEHAVQRVLEVCERSGFEIARNTSAETVESARQKALLALKDLRTAAIDAKPSPLIVSLGRGW